MRNLYLLPTENPSRIYQFGGELLLSEEPIVAFKNNDIYIISDEKIKEGNWVLNLKSNFIYQIFIFDEIVDYEKKIIMTTAKNLIDNGIQSIDNEFLEWFVDNSSCRLVKLSDKKIIIPIDKVKQRDYIIQIMQEDYEAGLYNESEEEVLEKIFYSDEEVLDILHKRMLYTLGDDYEEQTTIDWFKQLKIKLK